MRNRVKKIGFFLVLLATGCQKKSQDTIASATNKDFTGKAGIYYLGSADILTPSAVYSNPSIAGIVVRFKWETLETSPGVFDWSFIDGELAKVKAARKKISLQPLGYPSWIVNNLGAATYWYIDRNSNHSTYLDTLQDVLTWDDTYLSRVSILIVKLAERFAGDTSVSYCNAIAGQVSRGLPDSVITPAGPKAFYTQFSYNADVVVTKMKSLLDLYMTVFPSTPLWNSIDYVSFEPRVSGKAANYLASQYADYGTATYPDRFGCWREDLSGCNPQPSFPSTSQWSVMEQHKDRTGSQMLWSVQDGPNRMNKCGILPNTKQAVLDSAINNGMRLGMRYFEIYGADINDPALAPNLADYQRRLQAIYKL